MKPGDTSKVGEIAIGPLTVYFPDASLPDFWFAEDLTGMLGVETNDEAEQLLKAALGPSLRGFDLDSEADNVVLSAKGAAAMTRALAALDRIAVRRPLWTSGDLHDASEAMRAWRRPKPIPYDVGVVVGLPLRDGTFGAGHVVGFQTAGTLRGFPLVVALDAHVAGPDDLARIVRNGGGPAVGCRVVIDHEILTGEWPVVGTRAVDVDAAQALLSREQGTSSSASLLTAFVEAYLGLRPWDEFHDPRKNELLLLPGIPPPASRCYLRDLFERRLTASFGRLPAAVLEGPAVLDVHIAYPGNGLPRLIDLPKSRQLAARIRSDVRGASEVFTGGGRGFLDVFAATTDAAAGIRAVEAAARDLGIHRETMVEAFPTVKIDGLNLVT
jgi:hypothetical protein